MTMQQPNRPHLHIVDDPVREDEQHVVRLVFLRIVPVTAVTPVVCVYQHHISDVDTKR